LNGSRSGGSTDHAAGCASSWCPGRNPGRRFTQDFEGQVIYLAQVMDRTTVCKTMRVAWTTVGGIVERVVARLGPADRLDGLAYIGIDELSYRRHHEYITTVVDHVAWKVVWAAPGKSAATVDEFFKALGPERAARIKTVTMSGAPSRRSPGEPPRRRSSSTASTSSAWPKTPWTRCAGNRCGCSPAPTMPGAWRRTGWPSSSAPTAPVPRLPAQGVPGSHLRQPSGQPSRREAPGVDQLGPPRPGLPRSRSSPAPSAGTSKASWPSLQPASVRPTSKQASAVLTPKSEKRTNLSVGPLPKLSRRQCAATCSVLSPR
jgi:hypothetical protein